MRRSIIIIFTAGWMLLPGAGDRFAAAQRAEVGFGGSGSFYSERTVTAPPRTATTGFEAGWGAGAWVAHHMYRYVSGEVRYWLQQNDLKLAAGGTKTTFGGRTHAIHYDLLIHAAPMGSAVRPYVAVGGGVKGYFGTGEETAVQPLQDYALLTKTSEWKGLITVGGGVKFSLGPRVILRVEVKDYLTPFPTEVIAPAPGADLGGWIHNIVPQFGVSFTF